jgi:hypothetical protein
MVDAKTLKLSDVGVEFIATKAGGNHLRSKLNPERQLIRY